MPPDRIDTSVLFKREVVEQDLSDYLAEPLNLRRAFHVAIGLFSLRDWTKKEYPNIVRAYASHAGGNYQDYLERRCQSFAYIRDLANSAKHATLSDPSTEMVGLANTAIQVAIGGFQPGAFQSNAFATVTRTYIASEAYPDQWIEFLPAAKEVMAMWDEIFLENGWA